MAASNTPSPPGEWLAKPSSVADTNTTATVTKPRSGLFGTSTYIASEQNPRSMIPITIWRRVSGPVGSRTSQFSRPTTNGVCQNHIT